MQPRRGSTLKQFIDLLEAMNECFGDENSKDEEKRLFGIRLYDNDYNRDIARRHCDLMKPNDSLNNVYDPNIHFPLILELTKKRHFLEHVDTEIALKHMKQR